MILAGPNALDMENGTGIYCEGPDNDRLIEQNEYLNGLMHTDRFLRYDVVSDTAREIDPFGHGMAAFWRGFVEGCGTVGFGDYPRFELRAGYFILCKFACFLEQRSDNEVFADLIAMCSRGYIRLTGKRAQSVITYLYADAWIAQPSKRVQAEEIMRWQK